MSYKLTLVLSIPSRRPWSCIFRNWSRLGLKMYIFLTLEFTLHYKTYLYPFQVTFSGLLNTLDGVASTEERIVFMTTNFLNRLDPALIRPGRVDFKHKIGYADSNQVERMFRRFYPDEPCSSVRRFTDGIEALKHPKSMAQLQGYFMRYKTDPNAALENVKSFGD